ncbi:class D sortase [Anoxybacteroides tepidamans]|uniref:class D sortase n=1 Tax=Anoxybacteroides tepidamans TaxID=265948 RepID=UPI000688578E|nr:class D sortase [Anoxybacillus tepidamans]
MIAGIAIATWSGYAYWQGYRAAQPLNKQSALHVSASRKEKAVRPKNGERIGALFIPKLNLSLPIYEGVDEAELRKGVGHYPKSALPGKNGNVVLSGHRDTVFRRLKGVGVHDQLIVRTARGEFVYRIKKVRIVGEDDRTVLVEKPRPTLTVTTCYPFDFIGNAKQRYVLIAELVRPRQRI